MKVCGLSDICYCLCGDNTEDLLRDPPSISFKVYKSSDSKPGLIPNLTMREKERQQPHLVLWLEVFVPLGFPQD